MTSSHSKAEDYHELHDQKAAKPDIYNTMMGQLNAFLASLQYSQANETGCGRPSPAPSPSPSPSPSPLPPPPHNSSDKCSFASGEGLKCSDAALFASSSKEDCCGLCLADKSCVGATHIDGRCHVKHETPCPAATGRGRGSVVIRPPTE